MTQQRYKINVNGREFEHDEPSITGSELLKLIGLHHSLDYEILLAHDAKESEPVELTESVDLKLYPVANFSIKPYPEAVLELDDEEYPFAEIFMTPVEIMVLGGYKDTEYYLKQIVGHQEITYKNDKEHIVELHNKIKFVTCKIASTTVS